MTSPEKRHLTSMASELETYRAKSSLQEIELEGLREAQQRKKHRAGINVRNLGTHLFSTEEVLETVQKAADATAARKGSGKGKGTRGRPRKAAELISEPGIPPSNEGNPFLESH